MDGRGLDDEDSTSTLQRKDGGVVWKARHFRPCILLSHACKSRVNESH